MHWEGTSKSEWLCGLLVPTLPNSNNLQTNSLSCPLELTVTELLQLLYKDSFTSHFIVNASHSSSAHPKEKLLSKLLRYMTFIPEQTQKAFKITEHFPNGNTVILYLELIFLC